MRDIRQIEAKAISGSGFHIPVPAIKIDVGAVAATCAVGIITAGPIGVGYCVGGIIVRQAVNGLMDLANGG